MYRIVSKLLIYGDMPKDSILMELLTNEGAGTMVTGE